MVYVVLESDHRKMRPRKAQRNIDPDPHLVIASNVWDYVELWLRSNKKSDPDALFYWRQARTFYEATDTLDRIAAPLTAYYCVLNASKALLTSTRRNFDDTHGVSGDRRMANSNGTLEDERVIFRANGVLPALASYLGDTLVSNQVHSVQSLLHNLPFVSRAFTLTYPHKEDLFIPVEQVEFVHEPHRQDVQCRLLVKDYLAHSGVLPHASLEWVFLGTDKPGRVHFLFTQSFDKDNVQASLAYQRTIRKHLKFINGDSTLWYVKRTEHRDSLPLSSLTILYAVLHRFSELTRYNPKLLSQHFENPHNWLLSEFFNLALNYFIELIACEITGKEIVRPGRC